GEVWARPAARLQTFPLRCGLPYLHIAPQERRHVEVLAIDNCRFALFETAAGHGLELHLLLLGLHWFGFGGLAVAVAIAVPIPIGVTVSLGLGFSGGGDGRNFVGFGSIGGGLGEHRDDVGGVGRHGGRGCGSGSRRFGDGDEDGLGGFAFAATVAV